MEEAKTAKNVNCTKSRDTFINFAEIGKICNMHNWLRGMDGLPCLRRRGVCTSKLCM